MANANCCHPGVFHWPKQCYETPPQQWLALLASKQPICQLCQHSPGMKSLGMAMVCCDCQWQMPIAAILMCSMDPSNVMKHCHNNGWPSLPQNSQFANFVNTLQR